MLVLSLLSITITLKAGIIEYPYWFRDYYLFRLRSIQLGSTQQTFVILLARTFIVNSHDRNVNMNGGGGVSPIEKPFRVRCHLGLCRGGSQKTNVADNVMPSLSRM